MTGLGWSGRSGRQPGGGFEQAVPLEGAVPAVGQVQGQVAAAVAGDVDQVAVDGGAAGLAQARLARHLAARSRQPLRAASAGRAALAGKDPDGR